MGTKKLRILGLSDLKKTELSALFKGIPDLREFKLESSKSNSQKKNLLSIPQMNKLEKLGIDYGSSDPLELENVVCFPKLKKLHIINISCDEKSYFSDSLINMPKLENLYLDINVSNLIPENFDKLIKLKDLRLLLPKTAKSDDDMPRYKFLSYLKRLETLYLIRATIQTIPSEMKNLGKLKTLNLSQSQINSRDPDFDFSSLTKLEILEFREIKMSVLLLYLKEIEKLEKLRRIVGSKAKFGDDVYKEFTDLKPHNSRLIVERHEPNLSNKKYIINALIRRLH